MPRQQINPTDPVPTHDNDLVANETVRILEQDVPLSQSLIWQRQRDFYAERALKAWTEDLVPNYITNNPFIAEIYADVIAAFLADCMPLSPENPLRIVELGAGTGKFSFLFLRKLTALLRERNIPQELVRYWMTDCSEQFIAAWRANACLAEFLQAEMLEFEVFRVGEENWSGTSRLCSDQTGPLVVIANYVFDSLPQDAFIISNGEIAEALVTTSEPLEERAVPSFGKWQLSFKNAAVSFQRYADASWNQILEHYRVRLSAATILFPAAALGALQQLQQFSDGRMLVLAADKGFAYEDELFLIQGPPRLEFHSGRCFSQTVNFDAIAKYFAAAGGEALLSDRHFSTLNICAFLHSTPRDNFGATRAAYRQAQARIAPDDVFTLLAWLHPHMEEMTVPQILAMLRLTRWDPLALMRVFPVLVRQLRSVVGERNDLRQAVLRTWDNHFPLTPADNALAFNCGVILFELRFHDEAYAMFRKSQQLFGPSAATSYNLGLCCVELGRFHEALELMREACSLDQNFEPARASLSKLEKQNQNR
jgi:tetratricopeptide (TPR) repeat protein